MFSEISVYLTRLVLQLEMNTAVNAQSNSLQQIASWHSLFSRYFLVIFFYPGPDPCARIDCCCGAQCRVNETNHARCECDFACILLFDPVCGSDGRTYGSACSLGSAACAQQNPRLRVVSDGECK